MKFSKSQVAFWHHAAAYAASGSNRMRVIGLYSGGKLTSAEWSQMIDYLEAVSGDSVIGYLTASGSSHGRRAHDYITNTLGRTSLYVGFNSTFATVETKEGVNSITYSKDNAGNGTTFNIQTGVDEVPSFLLIATGELTNYSPELICMNIGDAGSGEDIEFPVGTTFSAGDSFLLPALKLVEDYTPVEPAPEPEPDPAPEEPQA